MIVSKRSGFVISCYSVLEPVGGLFGDEGVDETTSHGTAIPELIRVPSFLVLLLLLLLVNGVVVEIASISARVLKRKEVVFTLRCLEGLIGGYF